MAVVVVVVPAALGVERAGLVAGVVVGAVRGVVRPRGGGVLLVSETNWVVLGGSVRLAPVAVPLPDPEPPPPPADVAVPFSTSFSCSSAAVRLSSAAFRDSWAEAGSSVAINCPSVTCCPAETSTLWRVPLALKLTATSVDGSTFPEPVTVDCTTPFWAAMTSRDVRAELEGAPISTTPRTATAIATAPRR